MDDNCDSFSEAVEAIADSIDIERPFWSELLKFALLVGAMFSLFLIFEWLTK